MQEADGGYCAECLTESIFTQADSWGELRRNVVEAKSAFYFDKAAPASIRLHPVRDEVVSVAWSSPVTCQGGNSRIDSAGSGTTIG